MGFIFPLVFFCCNVRGDRHTEFRRRPSVRALRIPPFHLTINQKLSLLIVFCVCLPLFFTGWSWYRASTDAIEQSAIESNERILQQTSEYLDLYFTNLENSVYPFLNHAHIMR